MVAKVSAIFSEFVIVSFICFSEFNISTQCFERMLWISTLVCLTFSPNISRKYFSYLNSISFSNQIDWFDENEVLMRKYFLQQNWLFFSRNKFWGGVVYITRLLAWNLILFVFLTPETSFHLFMPWLWVPIWSACSKIRMIIIYHGLYIFLLLIFCTLHPACNWPWCNNGVIIFFLLWKNFKNFS